MTERVTLTSEHLSKGASNEIEQAIIDTLADRGIHDPYFGWSLVVDVDCAETKEEGKAHD